MKIKVNLYDNFSQARTSVVKEVSNEQLTQLEQLQAHQTAIRQFKDNINWDWVIEEIEILAV